MTRGIGFDLSDLSESLLSFEGKITMAIEQQADDVWTKMLESYAKENARWQNRTGHARQRLSSDYIKSQTSIKLRLMHGVDYGKWLELANEKKYGIIPETIEKVGSQEIMPAFENFMERLK